MLVVDLLLVVGIPQLVVSRHLAVELVLLQVVGILQLVVVSNPLVVELVLLLVVGILLLAASNHLAVENSLEQVELALLLGVEKILLLAADVAKQLVVSMNTLKVAVRSHLLAADARFLQ